jgi:hypothetical protein
MPGHGWQLVIDDELIAAADGFWCWSPGFYAGLVQAEVFDAVGVSRGHYQLDVAPDDRKLGADIFRGMIDDIWEFDPELILGTEPAQHPIGATGAVTSQWLQYARLRLWSALFLRSLSAIALRPLHDLKSARAQVFAYGMRTADKTTVLTRLRNPRTLSTNGAGGAPRDDGTNVLFDVPTVREGLDGSANRCMASIVRNVSWRVVQLLRSLEQEVKRDDPSGTRTPLAVRWPRRRAFLMELHQLLLRIQRIEPLRSVTRAEVSSAGLTAISADPSYSAAYRLGWKVLRPGIAGIESDERAWLSPTWEIYENWCFVAVAKWLRNRVSNLCRIPGGVDGVTADCVLAGVDNLGRRLRLFLQPKFPAGDQKEKGGFRSLSGQRIPDIVLTCEAEGKVVCIILDAKYRTQRPDVLDAMTSAHVYRDSLRFHGRPVNLALLLVPRSGGAPWLEDPVAQHVNRVGVVALSPDHLGDILDDVLTGALAECVASVAGKT